MNSSQIVEAVLFASDAPLKVEEIARADETLDEDRVEQALTVLKEGYAEQERAFHIVELAEGFQILTRPDFAPYLERFDTVPRPSRLSGPALETLAIIAYRQPIGRVEMEYIRGVNSSGVIRTLLDRMLVEVVGRAEGLGRPLLYGTTQRFLEHFGFRSLDDLPRPEELPVILRDGAPLETPATEPDPQVTIPLEEVLEDEAGMPAEDGAADEPEATKATDSDEAGKPDEAVNWLEIVDSSQAADSDADAELGWRGDE